MTDAQEKLAGILMLSLVLREEVDAALGDRTSTPLRDALAKVRDGLTMICETASSNDDPQPD
jgi:hypothetical protein